MQLTVTLHYSPAPQRPVAAWFIPGVSAAIWLAEITRWAGDQRRLHLLPVTPRGERQPRGVLVVPASGAMPLAAPHCQAYGRVGERLYVPVEAHLRPALEPDEQNTLLPSPDAWYVWHPVMGLLAYEPQQVLRVSDLLAAPPRTQVAWDRALPGVAINKKLVSIEPDELPTIERIMQDGRDDIGRDASEPQKLPPHPHERGALTKVAQSMLGGVAGAAMWVASQIPGPGAGSGAFKQVQEWAERQLERLAQSLEVERHKELARLLRMLDENPDEGLRFALPLTGDAAPRGVAPPGARLGQRNTDFSLGRLGGGQAVDSWDAGAYRAKLLQRYRELANRELALGRHRRAAYIFAELLGDLAAAASALEGGGQYREAAVLFEQRLRQPHKAAECLARGGLWAEAITIYERLQEYELAGDLYVELNDRPSADAAYEQAISKFQQADDHLGAARVMENRLGDIDRAYACLLDAWPAKPQAARCLETAFGLLARHQRHGEAERHVRYLSEHAWPNTAALQAIERLSHLATAYPHAPVSTLAADRTRVMAAQRLEVAVPGEAPALLQAISRLAPGDRLLQRDTNRYLQQHAAKEKSAAPRRISLSLLRGFHLPTNTTWKNAVWHQGMYYIAGWRGREIVVVRATEDDEVQVLPHGWHVAADDGLLEGGLLLAAPVQADGKILIHPDGGAPLQGDVTFPLAANGRRTRIGSHAGITRNTIGLNYGEAGRLLCVDVDSDTQQCCLSFFAGGGNQLAGTFTLELPASEDRVVGPLCSQLLGSTTLLGSGSWLNVHRGGRWQSENFQDWVASIACPATAERPRFAVSFLNDARIFWGDHLDARQAQFAQDMKSPLLLFLPTGHLVAADEHHIQAYSTYDDQLKLIARQDNVAQPIAILLGKRPNQFRLVFADGRVRVYMILLPA